ncbi:MAG TPA: tetratricopeptide repeat protein, partial [Albitalea sp.]|nr:tetratricopeptide repeat protein [Albitalea sp.]
RYLTGFPDAKIIAPAAPEAPVLAAAPAASAPPPAAPAASAPAAAAAPVAAPDVVSQAQALLASAKAAYAQQNYPAALEALEQVLNLPPNPLSQEALELAGMSRLRSGDVARARAEFDTYLALYPQGDAADRIRRELAALPQPPATAEPSQAAKPATETIVSGSTSMYYYGGNGQVRGQDFKDSPISGLPETAGEPRLSTERSRQLYTDVDLNWRQRDAEQDMRLVFRDSYTADLERSNKNRNRLSSAYFDYKSLLHKFNARLGRQSPTGGGVMGRFDGAQLGYTFMPKWKINGVAGAPSETLLDTHRYFYGLALDTDALLPNLGGGLYGIQQIIDGEIDRRAAGAELRFFKGGASIFAQLDYDTLIKGMNIAAVQGTLILEDNTVFNALVDKRAVTMLSLSNVLFFQDPNNPVQARTLQDKLATTPIELLRQQVKLTTPYTTQLQFGVTTPVTKQYQVGVNASRTNTGAIPPVPDLPDFKDGRPATGNIYTLGGQLIGLNLYSPRDTHVLAASYIRSPFLRGRTASYNLSSVVWEVWQLEPSLQYYADKKPDGGTTERWTPGLRFTYRGFKRMALESNVSWELGKTYQPDLLDPTKSTRESSTRVNYSLGARYDF